MEQKERLENYLDLFLHPGWKQFIEDFEESRGLLNSIEDCKNEQDLYYKKGKLQVIREVLSFEESQKVMADDYL